MQKLITFVLVALAATATFAQNVTTPRTPSPAAIVGQTVGISTVTIKYSRPSVKGRQIWGSQVPYGWAPQAGGTPNPAPWRAGANENTVITFSDPAKVEGQAVPAGSYGLFFVINNDNTGEVVLSKDFNSWGNFFYDPSHDLLRAKIKVLDGPATEMLTYSFANNTKNTTDLTLSWEKKQFPVRIEFAVDDLVIANAETELHGLIGFNPRAYASAATYASLNNVALDKGLAWAAVAVKGNKTYANLIIQSDLLRKTGKTAEADKARTEALAVANEADLNTYGYQLLAENQFDKGIEILAMATQRYPKSANAWDSLGEAYFLKGDKKGARPNFAKALTLSPADATKVNSEKYIKLIDGK